MTESALALVFAVGAAVAAAGFFAFAFMLLRRPETGLVALTGLFVLTTAFGPLGATLGSTYVSLYDLLCLSFAIVAVVRWTQQDVASLHFAWLGVGALIFLSLLLGIGRNGLGPAGNEARATELFYFWACASYFSSFSDHCTAAERRWARILTWGGVGVAVVVLAGWGLELSGYEIVARARVVGAAPFRVVEAGEAMFLASLMIVLLRRALDEGASRWLGFALLVFMLQVLLLQHRSVWLASITGVLVLAMLDRSIVKRLAPHLPLALIPAALAVSALLLKGVLDGVTAALTYSVQNDATISWRFAGWVDLVTQWQSSGAIEKLIGEPFGKGFRRYLDELGVEVARSPHNSYLALLLRVGIAGLAAVVVTYAVCFVNLSRCRKRHGPGGPYDFLIAALAAQLVYFMFYGPNIMQGVFLGSALSVLSAEAGKRAAIGARVGRIGIG